jgi:hypothetical protein
VRPSNRLVVGLLVLGLLAVGPSFAQLLTDPESAGTGTGGAAGPAGAPSPGSSPGVSTLTVNVAGYLCSTVRRPTAFLPGDICLPKTFLPSVAPGVGILVIRARPGTKPGTCKLVAVAGTSMIETTITPDLGGGC